MARASAKDRNLNKAMLNYGHNHEADTSLLDKLKFDVELEKNFENDPFLPKRDIYHYAKDKVAGISDVLNIPMLHQKNSTLHRRKKRHIPILPKTVADFEKLISDKTYSSTFAADHRKLPFYRGVWTKHRSEDSIVYISESVLQTFNTEKDGTMRGDGTFKVLPRHIQFRQLFIISVEYRDQSYPLAYILMKKRNFRSYDTIFGHLKSLITVNITEFMADYETATRKAVRKFFPNAMLAGCYFHYCQAIRKASKRFGMWKDALFADAIKEVSSLALLPKNFVSSGFQYIGNKFSTSIRWGRFSDYWNRQWRKANISVYGLINRTNNFAESLNKSINSLIKRKHPDIWVLIHNIKKVERDKADEILKAYHGTIIHTRRSGPTSALNKKINDATEIFERTLDIPRFLANVTCDTTLDILLKERVSSNADDEYDNDFEDEYEGEDVIPNDFNNAVTNGPRVQIVIPKVIDYSDAASK